MKRLLLASVAGILALTVVARIRLDARAPHLESARAQAKTSQAPAPVAPKADDNEGIPITNDVVRRVCGDCHKSDAKGRMSRISFRRTTPEGWQETIRRMVTLNKADVDPADARVIVKYLSDHLGLAPEELKPAAFEVERRMIDFKYAANADTERVCASCHSIGRVMLQRRTGDEWNLVVAMHRGYYPLVDTQVFRRFGPVSNEPGPDGRPPDNRQPMDKALAHLKSAFPFTTPEWTAWSATMRSPRLEGTWLLSGYEPGQGPLYGTVAIAADPTAADTFTTVVSYTYPRSGRTVARRGKSIIYTGHEWRGRTTLGGDDATSLREVMEIERDWQSMTGRWFSGDYDELGLDVKLTRVGRESVIAGVDRPSLQRGTTGQQVRIFGANLPTSLAPRDVDFGAGVSVTRVVDQSATSATVDVNVAADAQVGARDLFTAGVLTRNALVVYDKVDYIKVGPAWNMARVGGNVFPKMLAQFEAIAYSNGPDGKPDTRDDLALGAVDAKWSVEEYATTFDDDDIKFVGGIDAVKGLFTPALDGPNPARSGNRDNVGDVWIVAAHTPTGGGAAMRARAHLVVTVPLYMRWHSFAAADRYVDR